MRTNKMLGLQERGGLRSSLRQMLRRCVTSKQRSPAPPSQHAHEVLGGRLLSGETRLSWAACRWRPVCLASGPRLPRACRHAIRGLALA